MKYNTSRNKLVIPEYGRNVQKMIEYAMTIEDKEKRNKHAKLIVSVMGQMNPQFRDSIDNRHKLWDHMIIISDFKFDVDSPFPYPSKDILYAKPDKLPYKNNDIPFRQYGINLNLIIEKAIEYEDGPEKDALVKTIANHLKKSYLNWNRDSVNDELITKHLDVLSKGKLKLSDETTLNTTGDILARNRKKKFTRKREGTSIGNYSKTRKDRI